ncbi:MAG TPA: hypothetical protein VGN76_00895 [Gemmatimonadales bacterium]|jgi:hypothetical protein|nr:hypothetical protein [Gemmatimonadales bacterium]
MQRANLVVAALLVTGTLACVTPAHAQVTIGADLGAFSSYVWRGITYTNKFVLQPDAYVTVPVSSASLTAGGWFNIEPGSYNGATDISENGSDGAGLAEFDWWGEVGVPVGSQTTLTAGVTGYTFPNNDGFTKAANTVEIYGKAAFDVLLAPKLAVWYDVDKIKGAYFEGSISHSVAAGPKATIVLGALAGLSAGQGIPSDPLSTESFNFTDDGFTHLDLSAGVPFTAGPLSFAPALHFVITGDEATKFTKKDPASPTGLNSNDVKLWGGVTISWSKELGAAPAEPETK